MSTVNFKTFFKNHFDTKEISDDTLRLFTEDELVRLANDTSGSYITILADTTTAYQNFFGKIVDEATRFAIQQARTMTMDNTWNLFISTIQRKEGTIRSEFGKDTPKYQEFFPFGLNEYNETNLVNIETLMNRFINACNNNNAQLPVNFVDQFITIRNDFVTARNLQLDAISDVANLKNDTSANRDALEVQLMKNLLIVASNNIGHPERIKRFFNQTILGNVESGGNDIFRSTLADNEMKNIFSLDDYDATIRIRVKNTGSTKLFFGFEANATAQPDPADDMGLEPGNEITFNRSDIVNPQGPYLNVWNNNPLQGKYEVEVTDL